MNPFAFGTRRARARHFASIVSTVLVVSRVAWAAAKNDEKARKQADEAIDSHYLAMNMKKAESGIKAAIKLCANAACSPQVEATLHRDLATVYIAGMKKQGPGKEQMQQALKLDPDLQLNPDLATEEVHAAFIAAGGKDAKEPEPEADVEPELAETDEPAPADGADSEEASSDEDAAPVHWLSGAVQFDFMRHVDTREACITGSAYFCYADDGARYGTRPGDAPLSPVFGNTVQGGVARATTRVLVGYDYRLLSKLTLGARLGLAFGGAPVAPGEQAFQAFHLEARVQYLLREKPLTGGVFDPYLGLQGGSAQVDSGVPIDVWLADSPPPEGMRYELRGYRKTGKGFIGAHLGSYFSVSRNVAPFLELQYLQMLGISGQVFALRLGLAYGL